MSRARRTLDLPGALIVPALLGAGVLTLPILALLARIEWAMLPGTLAAPETLTALGLSLGTAALATGVCVVLGVPLALLISRTQGWIAATLRGLVTLPLVLPPLVGGLALLTLLGRGGLLGDALAEAGIRLTFTTAAVVIAQVFVALPFLVIAVEGALRGLDPATAEAAATLGAAPAVVLFRITLPAIAPGLIAGTILSFTRALGEFGATALFAGNQPGVTRTIPLAIYSAFNGAGVGEDVALALALLLITASLVVLGFLRGRTSA